MEELVLKEVNNFIVNNNVYVPSDDEGNSYQKASNLTFQKAFLHKHDNRHRPESLYFPDDMEDYKDEMEDFIEVYVLRY